MKGKPQHRAFHLPKRLGSLMVIVAGSALSFQMIRGLASRPGAIAPRRLAPRFGITLPGSVLPPGFPPITRRPVAEPPLFVVENPHDAAFLKAAPEGIDDAMIINPEALQKR